MGKRRDQNTKTGKGSKKKQKNEGANKVGRV